MDLALKNKAFKTQKQNPIRLLLSKLKIIKIDYQFFDFNYIYEMLYCGNNNLRLFKYIRKISEHYKKHEIENNKNINLKDFFKIYAISRHLITHNSSKINEEKINKLTKEQKEILQFFTGNTHKIQLIQERMQRFLVILSEHAFLIFKSFAIETKSNWKIFKYME